MGFITKEIAIGLLIAFFATAAGVFIYLEYFIDGAFSESLQMIKEGNLQGKILTLAAIPNLFVFFVFIKKKQDYRARGVLLATIITALFTLVLQFL